MNNEYKKWIIEIKQKILSTQIKASIAVNSTLIHFYWDLGKMLSEKEVVWGEKLVEQVARDLKHEFPNMKGLSRRNLFNIKKFYQFYDEFPIVQQAVGLIKQELENPQIVQQLVAQIPWGHSILIVRFVNRSIF